jgi:hypothetical protein
LIIVIQCYQFITWTLLHDIFSNIIFAITDLVNIAFDNYSALLSLFNRLASFHHRFLSLYYYRFLSLYCCRFLSLYCCRFLLSLFRFATLLAIAFHHYFASLHCLLSLSIIVSLRYTVCFRFLLLSYCRFLLLSYCRFLSLHCFFASTCAQ